MEKDEVLRQHRENKIMFSCNRKNSTLQLIEQCMSPDIYQTKKTVEASDLCIMPSHPQFPQVTKIDIPISTPNPTSGMAPTRYSNTSQYFLSNPKEPNYDSQNLNLTQKY